MAKMRYKSLAPLYVENERYLFLGNGINQLVQNSLSWKELLIKVCQDAGINIDLDQPKSNTLLFEEMAFAINGGKGGINDNIHTLKKLLAKNAYGLEPHPDVAALINSGSYQHFLTTNYDYCIEKCFKSDYDGFGKKNKPRPKFSLYRYNELDEKKIWHIHGECNNGLKGTSVGYPEASILIGFEHYADYLKKIHGLVKEDSGRGLADLIGGAKENWAHLFFTRDIDIAGFALDYNETHLWFLLNFRGRLIREDAGIRNTIRWIIPEFTKDRNLGKIQILEALGVKVILVKGREYADLYRGYTGW